MEKILFDSHTHLNDENISDEERKKLINLYKEDQYLSNVIDIGFDIKSSTQATKNANENDFIYAAVGIHPHDVLELNEEVFKELFSLATENDKVVAIGEMGLDYYKNSVPKEVQKEKFIKQIGLAKSIKKPIIIHDRDAHDDVFDILNEEDAFSNGVLLHCFSGDVDLAKKYIDKGAMISIAGPVTFKNAGDLINVAEEISLDHMLIETDSPFLTPVPFRGKVNNSTYVKFVADKIAEIKGIDKKEVYEKTNKNTKKFFRI